MNNNERTNTKSGPLKAGLADGYVIHNRSKPKKHRFKYQMSWCVFDLDQLQNWFDQSIKWRHNRFSVYSLYDADYVNESKLSIKTKLINHIKQHTGVSFAGRVMLFTHPRFLGYGFNSVNFYFCYDTADSTAKLTFIISEINNTPWGEKHLYIHDARGLSLEDGYLNFEFDKAFHISPFLAMNMQYHWAFKVTSSEISVRMRVKQKGETIMTVVLDTKITPLMENGRIRKPLGKSFQPLKMSLGIYWQAFKLWVKRIPVFDHPK